MSGLAKKSLTNSISLFCIDMWNAVLLNSKY